MTLDQAIKAFKKQHGCYDSQLGARSNCQVASQRFIEFLREHKVRGADEAREVEYAYNTARHYPVKVKFVNRSRPFFLDRPRGGCFYHVVVKIGSLRIDWTARQFDPNAPFPLMWRTKS